MLNSIKDSFNSFLDKEIVDRLLKTYEEAKKEFYLENFRSNALNGAHFSEITLRLLQQAILDKDNVIPMDKRLGDINLIISRLEKERKNSSSFKEEWQQDSLGLHIPRNLRVIYDIRNKRNIAHFNSKIDPNLQDANLVLSTMDWIMAELIHIFHSVSHDEAQKLIDSLFTKKIPSIQVFDGIPKVLKQGIGVDEYTLMLLYHNVEKGLSEKKLWEMIRNQTNYYRTETRMSIHAYKKVLYKLVGDERFIHCSGKSKPSLHIAEKNIYQITKTGIKHIENNKLYEL